MRISSLPRKKSTQNIKKNQILMAYGALIVANLIWSAASPTIKLTLGFLPPFTFLFLRFLIVGLVLLPYTLLQLQKIKVNSRDIGKIVILGLFSQSSLILIFWGLKFTSAIDSAVIGTIGVLLSMASGHFFYNDKLNNQIKLGVIIAFFGTTFVVIEPLLTAAHLDLDVSRRIFGNALVAVYNIAFLLYIIWSKISLGQVNGTVRKALKFIHIKPMTQHYPSSLLMSISFYVGLLSMIPFALLENMGYFGEVNYSFNKLGLTPILGLLYMSLISSIVAYFAFEWSLNKVTVSDTAIMGYLQTVFTVPVAFLMLGEVPSFYTIIGGIVIAIGVFLAETAPKKVLET